MSARRPRRALLFCPGSERRKIDKAAGLDVDSVIIDLEDATALSRKAEARAVTVAALNETDFGASECLVRINPVGSGLEHDDLTALGSARRLPDGLVIPKTESAEQVRQVAKRLTELEQSAGLEAGCTRLLALVESATGILALPEIAGSDARLEALVFGAEDLAGDLGAIRTDSGHEVLFAKSALALNAAARGLQRIDTPPIDLTDLERLRRDTRASLELGYTGRLAIHPRQIEPIVEVFTPSTQELEQALRLLDEHTRQQSAGRGVFELDGQMVDMPMVRIARGVIERSKRAGLIDPD